MKPILLLAVGMLVGATQTALAVEATPTDLSCADFKPTAEATERFADLRGACESVVEIDGRLYAKVRAVVRRASMSGVTLNLPATDHTFTVKPRPEGRVLIGNQKVRPRDLERGQEISIHLPIDRFAEPNITEVALVQDDTTALVAHDVEVEAALPTTASPVPLIAFLGVVLLLMGRLVRRSNQT